MAVLATGARLGPYEILGPLRAGGMGAVYRARDTRLGRTVAVKLLKTELSADAHSRERFEREARTIAGLTHPHICALHDVGEHDGDRFLVMELLEGQTLTARVAAAKDGLPIAEMLEIAAPIADALAFAHSHRIVHRDLKPDNVMLTPSGVKLLDFGVARLLTPEDDSGGEGRTHTLLTAERAVVGTLAYMAPEQLDGRADERSDIFAFGAVLFETLTGRRAFDANTTSAIIAAIVHPEPPDPRPLRQGAPPAVCRVVRRCLSKAPDRRWQSAADLADELRWLSRGEAPEQPAPALRPQVKRRAWVAPGLAALLAAALAAGVSWVWLRPSPPAAAAVMRLEMIPAPEDPINVGTTTPTLAISRDGQRIAYASGTAGSGGPLVIRDVGELAPRRVDGAAQARDPFFSPDGQWIGFYNVQGFLKIPTSGGTPVTIAPSPISPRGASWGSDGTIVFATTDPETGLLRVSDSGGAISVLTKPNREQGEADHVLPSPASNYFPAVSPDGRLLAYQAFEPPQPNAVYVRPFPDVNAGRLQVSTAGGDEALWSRDGHELFFFSSERLVAARIDTAGGRLRASVPVPLFGGPYFNGEGPANYDISANGQRFLMIKEDPASRPPNTPIVMVLNAVDSLVAGAKR